MGDEIEWFTPNTHQIVGAVGQNVQATAWDIQLKDPVNNDMYSGTIVGGQLFVTLNAGANLIIAPEFYICVLPAGQTVPLVQTELQRYQSQDFVWISSASRFALAGNQQIFEFNFKLSTKRAFKRGARLVGIVVNRAPVAFAAGATVDCLCDLYIYGSP